MANLVLTPLRPARHLHRPGPKSATPRACQAVAEMVPAHRRPCGLYWILRRDGAQHM